MVASGNGDDESTPLSKSTHSLIEPNRVNPPVPDGERHSTRSRRLILPASIAYRTPALPPPITIRMLFGSGGPISIGPEPPRSASSLSNSHQSYGVQLAKPWLSFQCSTSCVSSLIKDSAK